LITFVRINALFVFHSGSTIVSYYAMHNAHRYASARLKYIPARLKHTNPRNFSIILRGQLSRLSRLHLLCDALRVFKRTARNKPTIISLPIHRFSDIDNVRVQRFPQCKADANEKLPRRFALMDFGLYNLWLWELRLYYVAACIMHAREWSLWIIFVQTYSMNM